MFLVTINEKQDCSTSVVAVLSKLLQVHLGIISNKIDDRKWNIKPQGSRVLNKTNSIPMFNYINFIVIQHIHRMWQYKFEHSINNKRITKQNT